MIATGSPSLDDFQLGQADRVLKREELTPGDEWRFRLLNLATWSALVLSATWLFVALTLASSAQWFLLIAASVSFLSIGPLLVFNVPFLRKVFNAARRERALGVMRPLPSIAKKEPGALLRQVLNLGLHVLGYPLTALGILAVSTFFQTDSWQIRAQSVSILMLGLACLLIYPVERARQRLRAVAMLRRALERGELAPDMYDGLTSAERRHIDADRRATVKESVNDTSVVLRMSDQFEQDVEAMSEAHAMAVYAAVRSMADHPRELTAGQVTRQAVEITTAVEYVYDVDRNEITIMSVVRMREHDSRRES